jgi:hypothetical protein
MAAQSNGPLQEKRRRDDVTLAKGASVTSRLAIPCCLSAPPRNLWVSVLTLV